MGLQARRHNVMHLWLEPSKAFFESALTIKSFLPPLFSFYTDGNWLLVSVAHMVITGNYFFIV